MRESVDNRMYFGEFADGIFGHRKRAFSEKCPWVRKDRGGYLTANNVRGIGGGECLNMKPSGCCSMFASR
jgi:hypothetical protein